MTPGARVQAAIELLDAIIASARDAGPAADTLIREYFRTRRYVGSGDRRAVRELIYRALRRFGEVPHNGRAALIALADGDSDLAAHFDGGPHAPAPITANEPRAGGPVVPAWIAAQLAPVLNDADQAALLDRATLDLRALPDRVAEVRAAFPDGVPLPHLPHAWRLPTGTDVERHPLFTDGAFEVQDAASQYAVAAIMDGAPAATTGPVWIDLCAGAGGKALAMAAHMPSAHIVASDTNRARLSRLAPRAARAGAAIESRLLNPGQESAMLADLAGAADGVLVDAPCSGSGTWRRSPELRWRLTPQRLDRLVAEQARLIRIAAGLVQPGGTLAYAVCSLIPAEGPDVVAAFLRDHRDFEAAPTGLPDGIGRASGDGAVLTPLRDTTDGFFLAKLVRS